MRYRLPGPIEGGIGPRLDLTASPGPLPPLPRRHRLRISPQAYPRASYRSLATICSRDIACCQHTAAP